MTQDLTNLETSIEAIGATFHTLPLLDDAKQRGMLRQAFADESLADIQDMLKEIGEIKENNRKISADRYVEMRMKFSRMETKVADYSAVLGEALTMNDSWLKVAKLQVADLARFARTKE